GDVIGVHDLDVRDVVAAPARAIGRPGCRDRVERLAHGPVADGVEVDLESGRVDGGDGFPEFRRVEEAAARAAGLVAVPVQVRGQHRGGEVLADAVLHDLDAGGPEPAPLAGPPPA